MEIIILFTEEEMMADGKEISTILPEDISIQLGCSYIIDPVVLGECPPYNYSWSSTDTLECPNCQSQEVFPNESSLYIFTVKDTMGCEATDEIFIEVIPERNVYIPNVFSPNGDGVNDYLCIYPGKGVDMVLDFKIFNRWGANVFEARNFISDANEFCWNGYFKEELMNNQIVAYYAIVRFKDGFTEVFKGDILILK